MLRGLKFFLYYGWKYDKRYVIERVLYQLTNSLIPVVATILPKLIIDELMGLQRANVLMTYVLVLAGYAFFATAASVFLSFDSFTHRCYVAAAFDQDLHRMLAEADFERLEDPSFLDMRKKAEKFLSCDYHGFGYLLDCALDIAGQAITLMGIAAIVASLGGWLIGAFAALSMLAAAAEMRAKKRAMALWPRISASQRGWMYYSRLFEDFRFGKEIRVNGIADWLLQKEKRYLDEANADLKTQNDLYIRSGALGAGLSFIQQLLAYAVILGRVLRGAMGIGDFAMYAGAVTAFGASMRRIMESFSDIRTYDAYYDALDEYLHIPANLRKGKRQRVSAGEHRVEFRNVGFRYPGQACWALRGVSLTLEPGEKLSVVGENGAGKTTFIKLLLRLYDPTEGEILLDGTDIRDLDIDAYQALFGTVFQDFALFSCSIRENVAFGAQADDEQIEAVLRLAGLEARLRSLPKGIDAHVNREFDEEGFEPSGGEAQKIALARAIFRGAPLVVLDEPTAALDPRAEFELYGQFSQLVEGKTAVFISHRLASAQFCDRIAVFSCGQVSQLGTHDQLYGQVGLYRTFYDMQASHFAKSC